MVSVVLHRVALAVAFGALVPTLSGVAAASAAPPPLTAPAQPLAASPPLTAPAQPGPDQGGGAQPPPPGVVFVEVTPGTVAPGYLVGIRASCQDNAIPATVVSDAFGRVQVQPQRGLLTAAPMVNDRTRPGNYRVKLDCPDGATAATMLQVVKSVKPSPGPHTGFGGAAAGGGVPGGLLVPGGLALTIAGAVVGIAAARRPRGAVGR
ncbi:hypothetical protein [Micromonospora sp. NPDC092111]|uniref:hypothetical protein n=1 Tax=Micromonospora sp. NPDC092111 TaxID=3364289 RepID=UPI0037FC823C